MRLLTSIIALFIFAIPVFASDVNLMVDEITDTRTTRGPFAGLRIKFKPLGDDVIDAAAIRINVKEVIDDTGKSLVIEEKNDDDKFVFLDEAFSDTEVELKNPKRRSKKIKKLTAEITLYNPEKDPYSIALISGFIEKNNQEIVNEVLKKSNVSIRLLSKKQYEEWKSKEQEQLQKEAAAAGLAGEMLEALSSLFSGLMTIDDKSVIMLVNDPESKIIKFDFIDKDNKKIETRGSMQSDKSRVFNFSEKIPDSSKIKIYLQTEKSNSFSQVSLNDIALP